jgi:hypothetical protein
MRKAKWPKLKELFISKKMLILGGNYFGNSKYLTEGLFPKITSFRLYWTIGENNKFYEPGFLSKLEASIQELRKGDII